MQPAICRIFIFSLLFLIFLFFFIGLRLLIFLARKFALVLSIEARSQTAWAAGLHISFHFLDLIIGQSARLVVLETWGIVSGLAGGCCNVVDYVNFFYLDRQRQDRAQATFLIKTQHCQG